MVRTRGDKSGVRDFQPLVAVSKTPSAAAKVARNTSSGAGSSSSSSGSPSPKSAKYSGGNGYHPRPTPEWQKPVSGFFTAVSSKTNGTSSDEASSAESSGSGSPKSNSSTTSQDD